MPTFAPCLAVVAALILATGCASMIAPYDGQPVFDTSTPVDFRGYTMNPNQEVRVLAFGHETRTVLTTVRSGTLAAPSPLPWSPAAPAVYEWTARVRVPGAQWSTAPDGVGRVTDVGAAVIESDGSERNLITFRAGYEECATRSTYVAALNCAVSPMNGNAYLYTRDFPISADFRITGMVWLPTGFSVMVLNAGRAGKVVSISCTRSGVALPTTTLNRNHGPAGSWPYTVSVTRGAVPVSITCTVSGTNIDGIAEANTTNNSMTALL